MDVTDAAAVALARAGDGDAFRVLVERHSGKIFRLAYRLTGNEQDAEDIVQETFLRAYKYLGQFNERAAFTSWLHRIATNYAMDILRSKRLRATQSLSAECRDNDALVDRISTTDPRPDRLVFSGQLQQRVAEALHGLTPLERAAFTLRHFEGQSIEEICAALKIGANAAKQSIFRAVQKVRRALEMTEGHTAWRT